MTTLTTPIAPEQAEAWMRDLLEQMGPEHAKRLLLTLLREQPEVLKVLQDELRDAVRRDIAASMGFPVDILFKGPQ